MNRALLVLLAACTPAASAGTGSNGSNGSGISAQFEHDMLVRMHMHENFGMVRAIEHLLVRGKLDEAKQLARGISQAPDEPDAAAWAAQAARVRDRAAAVASAATADEALHAVARLGTECAGCHVASGATPDLVDPPRPPPDGNDVSSRMTRHRWATDRLWEAVIAPSDDEWKTGLDVLAATPLPASELGKDREPLARKLQRTAESARTARSQDRAQVYGDLLATCAACHARGR
jgi:cytochrome c553